MESENKATIVEPFFFTFGFGHEHQQGYIKIHAPDENAAREVMHEMYGIKWAFSYSKAAFGDQAQKYGLYQVGEDFYAQV